MELQRGDGSRRELSLARSDLAERVPLETLSACADAAKLTTNSLPIEKPANAGP